MKVGFATTSSVAAFNKGLGVLERRGAPEACWMLLTGEAGYGKTSTAKRHAAQKQGCYVRAKAGWTPHWMLSDLLSELGVAPFRTTEAMHSQAVGALAKIEALGGCLVVDEAEHMVSDRKVIETLRDLTDMTEISAIIVGMERIRDKLARFPQISSRIASIVEFGKATRNDVRICCDHLAEVEIADDLVAEIHRQADGRLREIRNAIAQVERFAPKGKGGKVGLADVPKGIRLTEDWSKGGRRAEAAADPAGAR